MFLESLSLRGRPFFILNPKIKLLSFTIIFHRIPGIHLRFKEKKLYMTTLKKILLTPRCGMCLPQSWILYQRSGRILCSILAGVSTVRFCAEYLLETLSNLGVTALSASTTTGPLWLFLSTSSLVPSSSLLQASHTSSSWYCCHLAQLHLSPPLSSSSYLLP